MFYYDIIHNVLLFKIPTSKVNTLFRSFKSLKMFVKEK